MVFDLEETWLLYATQIKAAVNKQMKGFASSWKKVLHNDLELLCLSQSVCGSLPCPLYVCEASPMLYTSVDLVISLQMCAVQTVVVVCVVVLVHLYTKW